jgi:TolB-like protein/serine/threonine protein kinase/Tfp pilus assembly protein PilF
VFAPTVLPEGSRIRNCLVEKKLGKGGFGITYLAAEYAAMESGSDPGPALRKVAIKEFFPQGIAWREDGNTVGPTPTLEGAGEAFLNGLHAFYKEAQALAGLDHQNVVRLLSVFQANGTAYFIMPFIRGESLRTLLKREDTLSEERARRLLLPVLDGLAHAHAKGILHRDLKPDNIMISEEDGRPILIDFGTARAQAANDATQYTRVTDLVAYTPGYAALEQYSRAASDNRHGPWTDLYAFGALLCETITGQAPPEAALRAADLGGGNGDPLTPVSVRLKDSSGYGRAFLLAIDWALELAAKDRPQSIAEFRAALDGRRLPAAATLARLEAHGVSVEPLTVGPNPTASPATLSAAAAKAQVAQASSPSIARSTSSPTGGPGAEPRTAQPEPLPAERTAMPKAVSRKAVWVALPVLAIAIAAGIWGLKHRTGPDAAIPAKSIAVLPFENLSEDKANGYFASGMQDEILTRLAGIHDLKVISRTSTEQYASRPPNLKVVGEQLGVATVLEGSVQKAGDQAHINLQLIDAQTDTHRWADSYDRDLKDLFGVERDVAQKVAEALKAQLLPEEAARVAAVPTANAEAYDLYLRANAHANRAYDQDILVPRELPQAIELYQQALAKDPGFALADAALARAHMYIYFYAPDRTQTRLEAARTAAERALSLQPGLGEGHYALALYYYWGHRDYAKAVEQAQLARQALPNSVNVAIMLAGISRRQGQWEQAIADFEQAAVLDPRSANTLDQLALSYSVLRRYGEADQAFARAVALTADPADELVTRAQNTVAWKGDLGPLRAALNALTPGSDAYTGNARSFWQLAWRSRDYAAAARAAERDAADSWNDQTNVALPRRLWLAWAYAAAGDKAKAQPLYTTVRDQTQASLQQRPDDADLHMTLAFADAGLGLKDEALDEGRKAASLMPPSRDAVSGPARLAWLAQLAVRLGENDQALDLLQQLMAIPAGLAVSPALLKLDPVWDPLRKDPRFKKLAGA